jgi:hypothetical protein
MVKAKMESLEKDIERRVIFDRKLLDNAGIKKKIRNHEYIGEEDLSVSELASNFHSKLNKLLLDLNVIREEQMSSKKLLLPMKIKRLINIKREKDKEVRKGLSPLKEYKMQIILLRKRLEL